MQVYTILQFAGAFGAYFLITILVPAAVFGAKIQNRRLSERFLFYFITGNFYVMNLVFLLQLIHISNRWTLLAGTVIPVLGLWIRINSIPIEQLFHKIRRDIEKFLEGRLGLRTACHNLLSGTGKSAKGVWNGLRKPVRGSLADWVLAGGMLAGVIVLYGTNAITNFGYMASDLPVHNYWINYMGKNDIFVAGIYPFGFHCIIYYIHTVFGMDTYVLLRVFALVQNLMIHWVLLVVLKGCCKSKYTPYIGVYLFLISDFLRSNTYSRYCSTLPQEFGMLFILPCVYFAFAYFRTRKQELLKLAEYRRVFVENELEEVSLENTRRRYKGKGKKLRKWLTQRIQEKRVSDGYLAGFAMSFSMTLAVHFYDTMIAGLFCVGIAVGYCFRFFRKDYFWNVVVTCIISVSIAVFPMAAAFAQGTPLQGSLGWGMKVITGTLDEDSGDAAAEDTAQSEDAGLEAENTSGVQADGGLEAENISGMQADGELEAENISGMQADGELEAENISRVQVDGELEAENTSGVQTDSELEAETDPEEEIYIPRDSATAADMKEALWSRVSGIAGKIEMVIQVMAGNLRDNVLNEDYSTWSYGVLALIGILLVQGVLFWCLRQWEYGAELISTAVFMMLMAVLQSSSRLGLPPLMDTNRSSIYLAYCLPLVISLNLDGVLVFVFGWMKKKWLLNAAALAGALGTIVLLFSTGCIKGILDIVPLQTNGAITALTNIIREEKDFTWTICSANDEFRMGEDHGYHYEITDLLRKMENLGNRGEITIPTQSVFFFIEKIPLDYTVTYEGSGQSISEEGASRPLPTSMGLGVYIAENRWIFMSRMYYWAQQFQTLYPNEMKVYLETEEFICYKLEQNPNSLYNLAIDYGYNTMHTED